MAKDRLGFGRMMVPVPGMAVMVMDNERCKEAQTGTPPLAGPDHHTPRRTIPARCNRQDCDGSHPWPERRQRIAQPVGPQDQRQPSAGPDTAHSGIDPVGKTDLFPQGKIPAVILCRCAL